MISQRKLVPAVVLAMINIAAQFTVLAGAEKQMASLVVIGCLCTGISLTLLVLLAITND